ncbi:ABC transporter substrate-binding protein [Agrobacterium larrymoorei]|uniref:ABC transporter substrate-binding protein n=1 Tax=Agrobacterium larrymoorei TaxID=160699 RepID=A0AAF0KH30_9HYPH|nr:ABC transporter substrate-binding protein [Agrobacterium larrymoorei]WHA44007.1 ABC transporter substrate-binding protein [Agrobacterium larrymoorei]
MQKLTKWACAAAFQSVLVAASAASAQQVPEGYPADYKAIVDAGIKEGTVNVYSPTDSEQAAGLIKGFEQAYPGITVKWNDVASGAVYNRVVSEAAASQVGSDIVWSNGLDLQLQLVKAGYAEPYKSVEFDKIPEWARYQDTAYSTTIEPAVFMYNNVVFKLTPPKSHKELTELLKANASVLSGKVATFDPEKSAQAFVSMENDVAHDPDGFWALIDAFGAAKGKVYSSSGQLREKVLSGEHPFAFNVNGAYAIGWAKKSPNLTVVFPADYTTASSRAVFITKNAKNPNAAKLFLDYMLSKPGQEATANAGLPSIRNDVSADNYETINKLAFGKLVPVKLDESLLEGLKPTKRGAFFQKWKKAVQR